MKSDGIPPKHHPTPKLRLYFLLSQLEVAPFPSSPLPDLWTNTPFFAILCPKTPSFAI